MLAGGVSNFDVGDLEEASEIAGDGAIACNQVLYHLQERAIEHAVIPWCEARGVAVVGYSPFGHGRFPGPRSAGGRVLQEIADAHGATPRQVALRFLAKLRLKLPRRKVLPEGLRFASAAVCFASLRSADISKGRAETCFNRHDVGLRRCLVRHASRAESPVLPDNARESRS
jgi:diketogulonate reductase-like aldo/keto reductase